MSLYPRLKTNCLQSLYIARIHSGILQTKMILITCLTFGGKSFINFH
uniref:Uncharacterized protein n=1 Tax=Picea glauca TaxID=3330 RepID=A0A101M1G9_PICGL|nr:hypothetical protein ABT39_MTgene3721 [Picea glauca]